MANCVRRPPGLKRLPLALLVPLALAASPARADSNQCQTLVASSTTQDPVAITTTFAPGSLVIPMDSCYNPDTSKSNANPTNIGGACGPGPKYTCYNSYGGGNVRLPFGLTYLLTENGIPVSIILNQSKLGLADADFSVTPPAGSTTPTVTHLSPTATGYVSDPAGIPCGTNTIYYGGMPLVIDAAFASQALRVITDFDNAHGNLFTPITIHTINYSFTAPVVSVLASRPSPVVIDASPLDTFFGESGVTTVAAPNSAFAWLTNNGSNNYSFTWPAALAPAPAACTGGVCTSLTDGTQRLVDVVWTSNQIGNVNNWAAIPAFLQNRGTVLAIAAGANWETGTGSHLGPLTIASTSAEQGSFCPAVATTAVNPLSTAGPPSEYPASNRFLQIGDIDLTVLGNGGGVDGASSYAFSGTPATGTQALSNGSGYEALAGHPLVNGVQASGMLVYLAALNSWHGNSSVKDGGLHIMYNTLLDSGSGRCGTAELSRSSAVSNLVTLNNGVTGYANYVGTFDWIIPADPTATGNTLYQGDPTRYPYATGHFREYKPAGSIINDNNTSWVLCDPTSATSACNWDAATKMKPFAQRKVFVATGSFGSYTLTPASSLGTDPTIAYISSHLDVKDDSGNVTGGMLGGIDGSTAAVIEGRDIGSFTSRPGIAYVGGRDGMLHAFCVTPPPGSTQCYGVNVGEEIWAVIPPGAKKAMDAAYNGGSNMDWSKVNVGGAIRVADMSDRFEGSAAAVARTILLVGTGSPGAPGYIDALDITNPDPSLVNQAGFSFLWENDGTHVVTPATSLPMGVTAGATIAQLSAGSDTGIAVATSATCQGSGMSSAVCPSTVRAGFNTYALRLSDGVIVADEQQTYQLASSLDSAPIANDRPALPTVLDVDGDGSDESVYVATLEGYVRRYTLTTQNVTTPTLATFDPAKPASNVYNANTAAQCAGVACQPIGVSPTIARNVNGDFDLLVATGGADWARATTDKGDLTATTNLSYVTGFDVSTLAQYPTHPLPLGGIQPPTPSAGGSSPGITPVPMALRAYAQLTVTGTDLYADVTSISIGNMRQLVQPLITPGSYGTVLRWSRIDDGSQLGSGTYLIAQGTAFAGGAGSVVETDTTSSDGALFVPGISSMLMRGLSSGSSSLHSQQLAITRSSTGNRPFQVVSWFDLSD